MRIVLLDIEYGPRRVILPFKQNEASLSDIMNNMKSWYPDKYSNVVQLIDANTGEVEKGPKYDTTVLEKEKHYDSILQKYLRKPLQKSLAPIQYQPRDRFQENKNMSITKEKFQRLVQECLSELRTERQPTPRERLKESLRPMVEKMLQEIANVKTKGVDDEKEEKEKVQKGFKPAPVYHKDGGTPERLDITNLEKEEEIRKIVDDINKDWDVYWDDHNELIINAQNLLKVRITPKFENNFDIDAMVKLVDRVRAIGLTWEQVKEFVKVNFKEVGKAPEGNKTKADKAWEKSMANKVDQDDKSKDAGPRWDVIKNRGQEANGKDAKIKDTKKKDKDYNEPQVKKEEDQPDQPMADVGELKNLNHNIEKTPHVKPPKHKNDNTLKTSLPKTKKFIKRKSS